jgi:excisionase family DNA binding protein
MTTRALSTDGLTAAPSPSPSDLLTAEEVAALLRVTPAWVYAQTRRKRIPHLRLGRYVRYRREALDAWMTEVESSSSSVSRPHRSRGLAALG